ncbi:MULTISPECIES: hypothetical protein [unclassified Microcoleus]
MQSGQAQFPQAVTIYKAPHKYRGQQRYCRGVQSKLQEGVLEVLMIGQATIDISKRLSMARIKMTILSGMR